MIEELKLPKHFDERIYLITKFAQTIHNAFKRHFNSSTINYYFESCKVHRSLVDGKEVCACGTHRIVWVGPSILQLIHTTQRLSIEKGNAPVLYATPSDTKGYITSLRDDLRELGEQYHIAHEIAWAMQSDPKHCYNAPRYLEVRKRIAELNDDMTLSEQLLTSRQYWIGDVSSNGYMICGDDAVVYLWNKIRNKS